MPNAHEVVSPKQWLDARRELLANEKQLTQLREQIAQKRRAMIAAADGCECSPPRDTSEESVLLGRAGRDLDQLGQAQHCVAQAIDVDGLCQMQLEARGKRVALHVF